MAFVIVEDAQNSPGILLRNAQEKEIPLVLDSPHSGRVLPGGFKSRLPLEVLFRSADAYIDEIYETAPNFGASLLSTDCPRFFLDTNRSLRQIDVTMIEGEWKHPVEGDAKVKRGVGLIWKRMFPEGDIYDSCLSAEEVQNRIDLYWRPYHKALRDEFDRMLLRYGRVYHIDCHSMRTFGNREDEDGAVKRPEFVIGTCDGTSCEQEFADIVVSSLSQWGCVRLNYPYKGQELVKSYGDPGRNCHSLMIEIRRDLYMDESTGEKNRYFDEVQHQINSLLQLVRNYITEKINTRGEL